MEAGIEIRGMMEARTEIQNVFSMNDLERKLEAFKPRSASSVVPLTFTKLQEKVEHFITSACRPANDIEAIVEELQPPDDQILNSMNALVQYFKELRLYDDEKDPWNRPDRPMPILKKYFDVNKLEDQIQYPPPGEFDSTVLQWYGKKRNSAWIPSNRLQDFIWGENMRENFHTQFVITRSAEQKIYGTGPIEKTCTWYNCCFGPNDKRHWKQNTVPKDLKSKQGGVFLSKKTITGMSIKRGCKCSFTATVLAERPDAVLLYWLHEKHLDCTGNICHGLLDPTAYIANCHISPRLSLKLREKIERYLKAGLSPKAIIRAHFDEVAARWRADHPNEDSNIIFSRDMQLTPKDIWTIRESMRRRQPFYTNDDAAAIKLWVLQNQPSVLIYQTQVKSEDQPFILAWSTPWQQKKLAKLGHDNAVALDATFGTNHFGFSLYTIVVYDQFQNAIPVAFALLQKYQAKQVTAVLAALKECANSKRVEENLSGLWTPTCWIIDVADEEQIAIREVFPNVPITFCIWHVRRAWTKNIISKVFCPFAKAEINADLGAIMYSDAGDLVAESQAFIDRWSTTQPTFTTYYKREWHNKVSSWAVKIRQFNHSNQNTNGGIERWHHTMKVELKSDKNSIKGRSIPWLLERLKFIENHYWCMSAAKFQGRLRNMTVEQHVHKCLTRAKIIPDDFVSLFECTGKKCASVRSVTQKYEYLKEHLVTDWDRDCCSCTCGYSMQGNACKHQMKVLLMTNTISELDLLTHMGTKLGTFCGGLDSQSTFMDGLSIPFSDIANVTFCYDNEDFPEEPIVDPISLLSPPLEEFQSVVKQVYERIADHPTLAIQAMKELKAWYESVITREAQQNVSKLERRLDIAPEPLENNPQSDRTIVPKAGWVDKVMKGKRKKKGDDANPSVQDPNTNLFREEVLGKNAPEKLQIKRKDKPQSFQGKFDAMASNALQDMLEATCGAPKSTKGKASKENCTSGREKRKGEATSSKQTKPASQPQKRKARIDKGDSVEAPMNSILKVR